MAVFTVDMEEQNLDKDIGIPISITNIVSQLDMIRSVVFQPDDF